MQADDATFGGQDPCPGQPKKLFAQASCSSPADWLQLDITVPVTATARVLCPNFAGQPVGARVMDLDTRTTVWDGHAFTPSPGITAAEPASGGALWLSIASGPYSLALY